MKAARDGGEEGRKEGTRTARAGSPKVIRVESLPADMSLDELKSTVADFGEVVSVKMVKGATPGEGKTGTIEYRRGEDVQRALRKLHRRRVEGWDKRLNAYAIDSDRQPAARAK